MEVQMTLTSRTLPVAVIAAILAVVPLRAPAAPGTTGTDQRISLSFEDTDVRTVLLYLADMTHEIYVPAGGMRASVTYATSEPVPRDEAAGILTALLASNNYAIVPCDGYNMVLPANRKRPCVAAQSLPVVEGDGTNMVYVMLDNDDIGVGIEQLAKLTGLSVLPEPGLSGKVMAICPHPVSRATAVQIICAALELNGFAVERQGDVLKVRSAGNTM
jgi:type II secretory pathway component GspD/PulD (secretin)